MDELRPDHILQVGLGFWASKTLLSAVEMEVFTELAKHPRDLETLRGRLGLHPRSARDFFDALVALKFLERRDGRYYNTASTDFFLDKRKPSYIGGILEMANHRLYPSWNHLTTALRTGLPQNEIREGGANPFDALYAEPARLKEFLKAMTGVSHTAHPELEFPVQAALPQSGESHIRTLLLVGDAYIPGVHARAGAIEAGMPRARRVVINMYAT